MQNKTRLAFNKMRSDMARTYGVENVSNQFSVAPTVAQTLHDKITESVAWLQKINVFGVTDLVGQKVIGSVSGVVGKRTQVAEDNPRRTANLVALAGKDYACKFTEFDMNVKYAQLDQWAKFPSFANYYQQWFRKGVALARIRTGFVGELAATQTDINRYPNGEDVNTGWFQVLRDFNSGAQIFSEGSTAGQIRIGPDGDFPNLDFLVYAVRQLLDPLHRNNSELVANIGLDLLATDKAQLYAAQGQKPTEKERIEAQAVTATYGGLPVDVPPSFPERGLLITAPKNMSIYYQENSHRRHVKENPAMNQIDDFNSINDGYVLEDETLAAAIEFKNVLLPDGAGGWQ